MLDIDSQKRTSAELEDRAMRDALTGLYNRAAAQERWRATSGMPGRRSCLC